MSNETSKSQPSLRYIKNFSGNDFWRELPPVTTLSSAKKRARDLFADRDLNLTVDSVVRVCFCNGRSYDFYLSIAGTVACYEREAERGVSDL